MSEAATKAEPGRQLPIGPEIFLDHVGHFVADAQAASRALARAGFRAGAAINSGQSRPGGWRAAADRHGQRHRDVRARLYRGAVQDRRHAARPRVRCRVGAPCRHSSCSLCGCRRRGRASAARRKLPRSPAGRYAAAGRYRERNGHRVVHDRAARAWRDGGRAYPDPDPPHRSDRMAAPLAFASERRPGAARSLDRRRRRGGGGRALWPVRRSTLPLAGLRWGE